MKKKSYKINTQQLYKILQLREKGLSLREIGKLNGLSAQGVQYLVNKFQRSITNKTKTI